MGKVTDRILWSILVLAIGVSIFVVGKPAFVNLTNQVLHHDDLKATMQTPSLTSSDITRISAVNNDVGVSKHAYILASTKGISDWDLWNPQPRQISFPREVHAMPIPYGSYLKAIIKIKVNKPVGVTADISNYPPDGVSRWSPSSNDNDDWSTRVFIVDGKRVNFGGGDSSQQTTLTPDTWHTLEIEYDNSDAKNTSKVALYDRSGLDFWNNNDGDTSVQTKDGIFAVDAIKYRH